MSDPALSGYFSISNDLVDRLLRGSHQLAGVPEEDRSGVLRAALDAVPEAAELVRPYPHLLADGDSSASRLAFSCLSAAATFPQARPDQIADLGTLIAILFGFDDIADNIAGQWSHRDIAAFFEQLCLIVSGEPPQTSAEGALGQGLHVWQAWCDRFRGHEGAAVHASTLREQLELAGAAMIRERRWAAGEEPWPSYEEYVANGSLTILYPTWWAAALAICGPAPADAEHWGSTARITGLGAACMRLVNDVRTFEREKSEGKPSSVLILECQGMTTEAAVQRVFAHYAELNAAFLAAIGELPSLLAGVGEGQRKNVAFNGGWYMARDTHAYTVQELVRDADTYAD
ncbi:terpene synthase family protein [Nonomuraea sp. NPDC049784]|uniref:terpene synthase family protein n=1 Tax=Nonomuraea sp. NPDC049784 TaxID=3154361 RepID=UPI0033FCEED8